MGVRWLPQWLREFTTHSGNCCSRSRFLRPFPILRQEGGCSWLSALPFFSLRGGRAIKATREGGRLTRAHSVAELGCDFRAHHYPAWGSFTSANWQFPHTKSSLIRASVDSWSANGWHSSVCTWSFPTFKEENLPHDFSLPEPLITWLTPKNLAIISDYSPLLPPRLLPSLLVFSLCWVLGTVSVWSQFQTTAIYTQATCLLCCSGESQQQNYSVA